MTLAFFSPLPHRSLLRLQGADSRSFLQGLITADIGSLTPQTPLYTALLSPQGRYQFDFLIATDDHFLYIDVDQDRLSALVQRLSLFRLRAQVTWEVLTDWAVYALWPAVPAPATAPAQAWQDPRVPTLGARWLGPMHEWATYQQQASLAQTNLQEAPLSAYEQRRIQLGVPQYPHDLVVDKTIILEARFDALGAISWTKGCYMGQELMARTRHQGEVRKSLFPVQAPPGTIFTLGEKILQAGEIVGDIRSHVTTPTEAWALARLRLTAVEVQAPLQTESGVSLQLHYPAWFSV